MRKFHFSGALCSTLLLISSPAFAGNPIPPVEAPIVAAPVAQPSDWYVSGFVGASFLEDVDTDFGGFPVSVSFDTGFTIGATVGKRLNQNWRVEGELSYASYDADRFNAPNATQIGQGPAGGGLEAIYLMANIWYDFTNIGKISPYVGGGLGVADIDADVLFGGGPNGYDGGETKFAAQIGAGVSIPMGEKTEIDIGYRFKFVPDVDFNDAGGGPDFTGGDVKSHNIQAGLRFNF